MIAIFRVAHLLSDLSVALKDRLLGATFAHLHQKLRAAHIMIVNRIFGALKRTDLMSTTLKSTVF